MASPDGGAFHFASEDDCMTEEKIQLAKERHKLWSSRFGEPGYYQVRGQSAQEFVMRRLASLVEDGADPRTVLLVGEFEWTEKYGHWLTDHDYRAEERHYFHFSDRRDDDGDICHCNLQSEMDAEKFRNYIATSVDHRYYPIVAVVIQDAWGNEGKYKVIDRILNVPVYKNGHLERTIRPMVFNFYDGDSDFGGDEAFTKAGNDAASIDWRKECKAFSQLPTDPPKFLIDGLMPESVLTAITGHSFNGKSWLALQTAWSLATGEPCFGYSDFAVKKPVPVIYHVPEMHAAQVRHYANVLGIEDTENLLFRTMEDGAWSLDDPRMLQSAVGRVVFLDTQSFFNPTEDGNSYNQAMKQFGQLIFNLLNAGALGVTMLGHLAKPMQNKTGKPVEAPWTLENSIIGSAGYGALLRSLLRVKNLNDDLNDHKVHLYVQGMKNPGLKPFQLQGPAPLRMLVEPGKSPYLPQLLLGDSKYMEACVMFEKKVVQREIARQLGLSVGKINKLHKQWEDEQKGFDSNKENEHE